MIKQNEWVAVFTAVFVVGFFFIFGGRIISTFSSGTEQATVVTASKVDFEDSLIGGGEVASVGSRLTVHYVGHLTNGTVFDSSVSRNEPFQFVLGVGQVIKGWDEGLLGMRVGGKRTLTIPPEFGYGPNDNGPIPANSTLIFEVELLKVENQ